MSYKVKKLAELSGVTERALRWYDEIGLLKPAYYGENGYRYYEQEQLLLLQQILFYRELGIPLDEIRKATFGNDFDKLKALSSHSAALRKRLERTQELLKTIEKTVLHLRGQIMIKEDEMYRGFREWSKGKGPESYYLGVCIDPEECENEAEKIVMQSVKKNEAQDQAFYEKLEQTYTEIYQAVARCLKEDLTPDSDEVQKAIDQHYHFAEQFHHCSQAVYLALAKLYVEKEEFRKQLEHFHLELPQYMAAAMRVFADEKLS
ncbi:MerR family transcriptional regulator [Simkania sp.]|uniref:MerR family transcriptional regulator n=1 Tax=Simkania sp. TaxID=34094 RepID=UPI003B51EE7A